MCASGMIMVPLFDQSDLDQLVLKTRACSRGKSIAPKNARDRWRDLTGINQWHVVAAARCVIIARDGRRTGGMLRCFH
jgi:hypothetical protein